MDKVLPVKSECKSYVDSGCDGCRCFQNGSDSGPRLSTLTAYTYTDPLKAVSTLPSQLTLQPKPQADLTIPSHFSVPPSSSCVLACSPLSTLSLYTLPHPSHSSSPPLTSLNTIPKTHSLPPIHLTSGTSFTAVLYSDGTVKVFDHRTDKLLCTHMHSLPGCTAVTIRESQTDVLLLLSAPSGVHAFSLNAGAVVAVLVDGLSAAGVHFTDSLIVTGGDELLFV